MAQNELPMNLREDNLSEETKTLISSLPKDNDSQGKLCKYQGCWYYHNTLQGVINFQRGFKLQDGDIILASFPKSGTTWLKALTIAVLERSKKSSSSHLHPLQSDNPHGIVPFLESVLFSKTSEPDLTKFSSPRLFATHMPLHTLQVPFSGSPCKIVYVCRSAKDVLISQWHFRCAFLHKEVDETLLESLFKSLCSGVGYYGPIWEHVLSYWRGSLEDSKHVLFMRYEEMKADPYSHVKRLAEFLDFPFTKEEEESGCVDKILKLCSLENLSGLAINKPGKTFNGVDYKFFFRKGEVGGSKNYLTPEMESEIDKVIEEKLEGTGLKL